MKKPWFIFLLILLFYTRLVGIGWGLPYSFHPDEYKMSLAVSDISIDNMYSGFFWAYGAFHINIAFFISLAFKLLNGLHRSIAIPSAVILLRLISATFSVFAVYYGYKLFRLLPIKPSNTAKYGVISLFIFSPALIQLAHFGTTESILIFSLLAAVYYSSLYCLHLPIRKNPIHHIKLTLVLACAIAVKVIAIVYLIIPLVTLFYLCIRNESGKKKPIVIFLLHSLLLLICVLAITVFFSPHYVSHFKDMYGALEYERKFGSSELIVFYTRQFIGTRPFWYQFFKVFPYALGWPVFLLGVVGFVIGPRNAVLNIARLACISYGLFFLSLFTKWTRNMAPLFGLLIFFASVGLAQIEERLKTAIASRRTVAAIVMTLIIVAIIPGVAFLSIFSRIDTRYQASEWIYSNIPQNSTILTETANGIDIPIAGHQYNRIQKGYRLISFNFYELDDNPPLQEQLQQAIKEAEYIIIPTRRVFASHTCQAVDKKISLIEALVNTQAFDKNRCERLATQFKAVNDYYQQLFSGSLGFVKVKEFTAYPAISFFGRRLIEFEDESADETWSVFDHPVIRIYQRDK